MTHHLLPSPASHATASAISSGSPSLDAAVVSRFAPARASLSGASSVAVGPTTTLLTVQLYLMASSFAQVRVSESIPALELE